MPGEPLPVALPESESERDEQIAEWIKITEKLQSRQSDGNESKRQDGRGNGKSIAAIDLFVLPTIAFQILYCLVIVRHGRRLWVSFGVTANPTAECSRQVTEAFPWDHARRYLIRDRDTSYSCSGSVQWAFGTIRSHPDRPGKMLTLRDSSARSAANVSTT